MRLTTLCIDGQGFGALWGPPPHTFIWIKTAQNGPNDTEALTYNLVYASAIPLVSEKRYFNKQTKIEFESYNLKMVDSM
jgi:acyl-CoA thioesterase